MLFDINSCCSICPSEIFLNIDLEGELVYIFTEPDTGKQLPISEECCEIIGGKNLNQGDEYTGCDACVTYRPSYDLSESGWGILDYEESTSIKLSDEILTTCCEKDGYYYYSGYPLGISNQTTGEYGNRCWRCPRVISEETDGVPYKIGDVLNGKTIVDIQTNEVSLKEIESLIREKRIELEKCKSYQENLQSRLDDLKSSGADYKVILEAQTTLDRQKKQCAALESQIKELLSRYEILKSTINKYITLIYDDGTSEINSNTTTIIYKPEDPSLGDNISEYCCSVIKSVTRDRAIIYTTNGVCTKGYTKSLYE